MSFLVFDHWPLRLKTLVMLFFASTLPVATGVALTYVSARDIIINDAGAVLGTRADQLVSELDGFHRGYLGMVSRLARVQAYADLCEHPDNSDVRTRLELTSRSVLETDANIVGVMVVASNGDIRFDTESGEASHAPAQRSLLQTATERRVPITDIYLARPNVGAIPLMSYVATIRGASKTTCIVSLNVRASAFWDAVRAANGRAGEGSYTAVLDEHGIRIAHSFRQNQVFRPAGPLEPELLQRLVDTQQFGLETRSLVERPIGVSEEFERARAASLDGLDGMYHYFAPESGEMNLGVARRLTHTPWTVFAIVPERSVLSSLHTFVERALWVTAIIVLVALTFGFFFSERIVRPLRILIATADQLAIGDLKARVKVETDDEFGQLATTFNRMADALLASHENLESRVMERTTSLERANEELQAQKEELVAQRTELQAQQRELQIKNTEVERAGQLKTDFLSNMSHELRTPLNSIIGFSELLIEQAHDRLNERESRYLNDVLTSGRHLLSLINDILDLSKIEAGHVTLELTAVRPSDAITDALELVHTTAMRRNIEVKTELNTNAPVRADAGKLRQILLNLLSNALKFSPEGATVTVTADEVNGSTRFSIRDSGPGIDESLRTRLFQPFVQGESPMVKSFQGTGLGLAICRRLVEQHGGTIEAISPKGEGATFRFTIPRAEGSMSQASATSDGPLVLVVDDDRNSSRSIRDLLETAGYSVKQVESSKDTGEMVSRLKPAALVLNPATDERDGLRILDELRRRETTRDTPLVVTTAPRASDFVPKPIETQRFLRELKQLAPPPGRRVLAIDDDARVGSLLAGLLESSGYAVTYCAGGKEGIASARSNPPDVIIVDLLMPEMSGFEVIDALYEDERTRSIPVLVLTAADTSDGDRARMKQHARAIAQKGSITREELLTAIDRVTGRSAKVTSASAKTVLVIDDHDLNRELARSLLEHLGYRVLLAEDGDQGIALAMSEQPNLVFMDLAMPKKDGFTAARELKNNPSTKRIPIVALTAMAMRGDEARAFEAGMDDYLTKPIERRALEQVLTRFMG